MANNGVDTREWSNLVNGAAASRSKILSHAAKTEVNNTEMRSGQDRVFSGWIEDVFVGAVISGHGVGGSVGAEAAVKTLKWAMHNPFLRNRFRKDAAAPMAELFWLMHLAVIGSHDNAPERASLADEFGVTDYELTPDRKKYRCVNRPDEEAFDIDFGCAACVVVCVGDNIIVGNAGDAAAVLLRNSSDPLILTQPHSVQNPVEQRRLKTEHAHQIQMFDDGFWKPVNLSQELNLTRSLGHIISSKCGMLFDPYVSLSKITADTVACVLCSSGVSEWLGPTRISLTMNAVVDVNDAVDQLCKDAYSSGGIDDCTVTAITFNRPKEQQQQQQSQQSEKGKRPVSTLLPPVLEFTSERKPSMKQRKSNRSSQKSVNMENKNRGSIWTVKDAAWAWGLGSLHANAPASRKEKPRQVPQRSPAQSKKQARALLKAELEAEDCRVKELELKLSKLNAVITDEDGDIASANNSFDTTFQSSGNYGFSPSPY